MPTRKTRILHLLASNFVGGPEKQILHHARDMRARGPEIWVGSFRDAPTGAEILGRAAELGLPTLEISSSGRFTPRTIFELGRSLRENQISLLCTHGYKANVIGWVASRLCGCPQVAFVRGWTAETWRVKLYERLDRFVLARVKWVACVSQKQADQINQWRKNRRPAVVVPNAALFSPKDVALPVDRRAARRTLGLPEDAFLVGAVGRLSVEKGQHYLLDAAPALLSQIPNLQLVVLGEGRERTRLMEKAAQLGIESRVVLPGFRKDVRVWMQAFDVLLNPSLTEGTPNVVLEAMALGTPVVATNVGGVPNLIRDQVSGLLIPPADPAAIVGAVSDLFSNPAKALRLARQAQSALKEHSPEIQRKRLLSLYAGVLQLPSKELSGSTGTASSSPFITVVLPVRNEEAFIGQTLKDLLAQEYPSDRFELLVVDGESEDATRDIVQQVAEKHTQVRLLHNPRKLSSAGRNIGVHQARGSIIAFIDGHVCISTGSLLQAMADTFARTGAACLARPAPPVTQWNSPLQDAIAASRSSLLGHGLDSTIYSTRAGWVDPTSAGAVYLREVFDRVGTFDESFDACEDAEFNFRVKEAGLRCYLSPALAIPYVPRENLWSLFAQMRRYGKGRAQFHRKHPSTLSLAQSAPVLFFAGTLAGLLVAPFAALAGMGVGLAWGVYGLAIALTALAQRRNLNAWQRLYMAGTIPVIHLGLAVGWMEGWLDNRATVPERRSQLDRTRKIERTEKA